MTRFLRSLVAAALVAGCTESLSPEDFYGVWGADGVRLTLSITQARFETPCWAGDMVLPIQVDSDRFTAIGNIHSQGGPVGSGESKAVFLEGHLDGDEMRLTVETNIELGPYTLHRGVDPTIPGCP